ncbi:MAG: ATP-binding protein [Kiritimatiellae bacterium]|nr:ATP-binding protein [Kiritimatiellia bacterium]
MDSDQSEFVALYGRRRVGKTFLVTEVFNGKFSFHHAGIENATLRMSLDAFREALRHQGHPRCPRLTSWIAAFSELETLLEGLPDGRKVVFLDELPWFDTPKSGFLAAFEGFWNGWAAVRRDILLVVCGSATTWIVNEILDSRGGLHNRVTRQLPIAPFTLRECEEYAAYKGLGFDRRQIAECYMALGGVAYYWSLLREGLSAAQNFDLLFFGAADEMRKEYGRLFSSLFKRPTRHIAVVEALGRRKSGMTRTEIAALVPGGSGGETTKCIEELCECGFLRRYAVPFHARRDAIYQLIDPFTLFHFQFLRNRIGTDGHFWMLSQGTPSVNAWRGLAFERLCLWHLPQIRAALGISGVLTDAYSWRGRRAEDGDKPVQIDLLLDRRDGVVDLCEMKFTEEPYQLDSDEVARLAERAAQFRRQTGTRKAVCTVLVAASGVKRNKYSGNIQTVVTLDDLFREI